MVEKATFYVRNPSTQIYTVSNLIAIWLFFFWATIAPMVHTYSQNNSDKDQSNYCIVPTKRWQEKDVQCFIVKQLLRSTILFYHNSCVSAQARLMWKLLAIVCTKNPCHWWHLALSCALILRAVSFLADYVVTFYQFIGMKSCSRNEITKQFLKVAKN